MNPNSHRAEYEKLIARCKMVGGFHPDTPFKCIGDIWADIYKRRNMRGPAAELLVGYLSEMIDQHFAQQDGPADGGPSEESVLCANSWFGMSGVSPTPALVDMLATEILRLHRASSEAGADSCTHQAALWRDLVLLHPMDMAMIYSGAPDNETLLKTLASMIEKKRQRSVATEERG